MASLGTVEVRGLDGVLGNLARLTPLVRDAIEAGLIEWGETVMGDAKELAPVDLGILRNSGFVLTDRYRNIGPEGAPTAEAETQGKNTPVSVNAVLGFGGPSAPYALIQHEQYPKKRVAGKQWKYLSTPAQAHSGSLDATVARHVRRAVDGQRGTA